MRSSLGPSSADGAGARHKDATMCLIHERCAIIDVELTAGLPDVLLAPYAPHQVVMQSATRLQTLRAHLLAACKCQHTFTAVMSSARARTGPSDFHTAAVCSAQPEKAQKGRGKERQAELTERLEKIAPQAVKRPKRSAEELAQAEQRVKEFSRKSMHDLRKHQAEQKARIKYRCDWQQHRRMSPVPRNMRVWQVAAPRQNVDAVLMWYAVRRTLACDERWCMHLLRTCD